MFRIKNLKKFLFISSTLTLLLFFLTIYIFFLNYEESKEKEIARISVSMDKIVDDIMPFITTSKEKQILDSLQTFSREGMYNITYLVYKDNSGIPDTLFLDRKANPFLEFSKSWSVSSNNQTSTLFIVFNLDHILIFYLKLGLIILLFELIFATLVWIVLLFSMKQKRLNQELNKRSLMLQKRLISHQKIQSKLELSEKQFRKFFDLNPASVWIEDFTDLYSKFRELKSKNIQNLKEYLDLHPDELVKMAGLIKIIDVNQATLKMYEATSKTVFFNNLLKVFTESTYITFKKQICLFYDGMTEFESEAENMTFSGKKLDVLLSASVIKEDPNRIIGILNILDITEHKKLERRILQLATILENISEMVIVTDLEGNIEYVNPAFEKTTQYSRFEIVGQNPRILQSKKTPEETYRELWTTILSGKRWNGRFINRKKDGDIYLEEAYIFPLKNERNEIRHFVAVQRDVTKEEELEEQLRQSQKMEAIGQLAGGIAHDFNNLLTVILGYSDIVMKLVSPNEKISKYLLQIFQSARRAENLTKQLLAFSRKQLIQPRILFLNDVLLNFKNLILQTVGENIDVFFDLHESTGRIVADPNQIEQILLNLVLNARDAMPQGGELYISTLNRELTPEEAALHENAQAGWYTGFSIRDTGSGMTEEIQKHIFEPFFTTKNMSKGTGLGLSTVYGIVVQNNGFIHLQSEPGAGTEFGIFFPVTGELPEEELHSELQKETNEIKGQETILFVEDQTDLREMATEGLKELGYTVIPAENGEAAIKLIDHSEISFDIIVTDVVMPKISGLQVVEHYLNKFPGKPYLFISGYSENNLNNHGVLENSHSYLAKPFTVLKLATAIRQVLMKH